MLALVSVTGLLGLGVMDGIGTLANGPATLSQMGNIAGSLGSAAKALLSIGQIALALLALAAFFYVMVFIVGAIGTARLPLRCLLLERAKAVAARRYVAWQAPAGLDASAARPAWRRRLLLLLSLMIPRVGDVRADLVLAGLECANDLRRCGRSRAPRGTTNGLAPRAASCDLCSGPAVVLADARTGSQFIVASLAVHQRLPFAAPRLARNQGARARSDIRTRPERLRLTCR